MLKRTLTAFAFGGSVVACLLAHEISAVIIIAVLSGLCAFEFYTMLRADAKLPNEFIGTTAAALYPLCLFVFGINGVLLLTTAFALVVLVWYVYDMHARITDVAVTFFGALYTGFLLMSLVAIRGAVDGFWGGVLALAVVLSVWANDVFAFLIGSRFGKHKMAPRISPAKSWEGFIAGMIASVAIWCLVPLIPGVELPWVWAVVAGIVCGWIGILGDLMESRIKRSTGHKDSGTLLPGHGGFLDRCDSLLLVAATAFLLLHVAGVFAA
ncbi:MAG: phosphatidate cytidylyltransferase [Coriobacteriia bacterium]|nr:phosphatidate cytidylyltransferase [Coriobacteriia bacterium]